MTMASNDIKQITDRDHARIRPLLFSLIKIWITEEFI